MSLVRSTNESDAPFAGASTFRHGGTVNLPTAQTLPPAAIQILQAQAASPVAAPSQAPLPTYFSAPSAPSSQPPTPTQPAPQTPSAPSITPQQASALSAALSTPAVTQAPNQNSSTVTAPSSFGGSLASTAPNTSLWQGAPSYLSQVYANMYSAAPGGIPTSTVTSQLNNGNPAYGVTASTLPTYFQQNLSGSPLADTNAANIGQNQTALGSLNLSGVSRLGQIGSY